MARERRRGLFLSVMALLFALLTVSNCTKPLQHLRDPTKLGIVIFGVRFESVAANVVLGPLMGVVLGAYAVGLWTMRRWVVPLAFAYAAYVFVNLVCFAIHPPAGDDTPALGLLAYALVAIGVSTSGAIYLYRRREALR